MIKKNISNRAGSYRRYWYWYNQVRRYGTSAKNYGNK